MGILPHGLFILNICCLNCRFIPRSKILSHWSAVEILLWNPRNSWTFFIGAHTSGSVRAPPCPSSLCLTRLGPELTSDVSVVLFLPPLRLDFTGSVWCGECVSQRALALNSLCTHGPLAPRSAGAGGGAGAGGPASLSFARSELRASACLPCSDLTASGAWRASSLCLLCFAFHLERVSKTVANALP